MRCGARVILRARGNLALRFGPVGDPLEYDSRLEVARWRGASAMKERAFFIQRPARRRAPRPTNPSTQNPATPQGPGASRHPVDRIHGRIAFCRNWPPEKKSISRGLRSDQEQEPRGRDGGYCQAAKGCRLGQTAFGASIAPGTARDLFTQVTQQDSPPTPPAQHILPHRLQPCFLRPQVIPGLAHIRRTGLQSHSGPRAVAGRTPGVAGAVRGAWRGGGTESDTGSEGRRVITHRSTTFDSTSCHRRRRGAAYPLCRPF